MKIAILCLLVASGIEIASPQTGQTESTGRTATRAMCDAAAPKLQEAGTTKFVLMLTLSDKDQIQSFKTESPKGLRLEKMKEVSAQIKKVHFEPAKKDGSPVAVKVRIEFDCSTEPTGTNQ
ncbi:MAG: hypothetical protein WA628_25695 [Terriglobales bacterium]